MDTWTTYACSRCGETSTSLDGALVCRQCDLDMEPALEQAVIDIDLNDTSIEQLEASFGELQGTLNRLRDDGWKLLDHDRKTIELRRDL